MSGLPALAGATQETARLVVLPETALTAGVAGAVGRLVHVGDADGDGRAASAVALLLSVAVTVTV